MVGARPVVLALALALVWSLSPAPARAAAPPPAAIPAPVASSALIPTTVYLPNITKMLGSPTGWQTPFIVQNVSGENVDLDIFFYSFADGSLVTSRHVAALKPGTSFADVPNNDADLPANAQFSVVIKSTGQVVSVVDGHQGTGERAEAISYSGISSGALKVSLPYVAKQANGWLTTFIIQNLGAAPASANIALQAGLTTVVLTRTIQPGRSQVVDPRVERSLAIEIEYAGTITADQPIAVVADAHNDGPDVKNPRAYSYNGVADPGTTTFVPYAAKNGDGVHRSSTLYVQNAGDGPAISYIDLYAAGLDAPLAFHTTFPLDPGERVRLPLDQVSLIPDGEYGVVLTGGNFAVLNVTTTIATAFGFTGGGARSRLYLPNVARGLGGPAGWSTPIELQSAGAPAATIKFHRFGDGALVLTQTVTGLATGQSIRIDPRFLNGLPDGQYSVVTDSTSGTLAAVVLAYSSGGDGAMAYEAFPGAAASCAPGCFDPNAYFAKTPAGFLYSELPPTDLERLKQRYNRLYGTILVDVAGRDVSAGGRFFVAEAIVFAFNPTVTEDPYFRTTFLNDVVAGAVVPVTRMSILGVPAALLTLPGEPNDSYEMFWVQGNYLVDVTGNDLGRLSDYATGVIALNQ